MIDWLIQAFLLSSVLLAFLVASRKPLVKWLGAKGYYQMWWMVPASLVLPLLPLSSLSNNDLFTYVVNIDAAVKSIDQALLSVAEAAAIVWAFVAILLTVLLRKAHASFLKSVKPLPEDEENKDAIRQLASAEFAKLDIFKSHHITSPFIGGIIRPYLVLPAGFTQDLNPQQRRLVLEHELQHLKQGDLRWNLLAQLLLIAFWFNPLAWMAFGHFRVAQEMSCDESVLAKQDKTTRVLYAKAMLSCAEHNTRPYLNIVSYGVKREMKSRLQHIQTMRPSSLGKSLSMIAACLLTLTTMQFAIAGQEKGTDDIRPVHRVEPLYPTQAAEEGIEGSVVVKLDIETDGSVSNVKVVDAQPKRVFDRQTKIAVRQWRWEPVPQKVEGVLIQLDYVLDKDSETKAGLIKGKEMEQIAVEAND